MLKYKTYLPIHRARSRRLWSALGAIATVSLIACSGDMCQNTTRAVVTKTVETSKGAARGVQEGIREGRAGGDAIEGAVVITSHKGLADYASIQITEIKPFQEGSAIELVIDNTSNTPIRLVDLNAMVLDKQDFAQESLSKNGYTLNVPERAKSKVEIAFGLEPDKIKTVRIWGADYPVP